MLKPLPFDKKELEKELLRIVGSESENTPRTNCINLKEPHCGVACALPNKCLKSCT